MMIEDSNINIKSVCGVLVIYHPREDFADRLPTLQRQVGQLVIVNNGCEEDIKSRIQQVEGIIWLDSPENNLAMAQNLGIHHALAANFPFVLLLDQDSSPAEGMVSALLDAYRVAVEKETIGIIAPHMLDENSCRDNVYVTPHMKYLFKRLNVADAPLLEPVLWVIASGSLIPAQTFAQAGFMDESYGIDYVDKEFCLRLVLAGLRIIVVSDAILHHQIGKCRDHRLLGLRITSTNHPASRRFTIYRNRIRTLRRYGPSIPSFLLYECLAIEYDLTRILFFERDKWRKLKAIWAGVQAA